MKLENIDLACSISPKECKLKATCLLTINDCEQEVLLLLNPDLVWESIKVVTESGKLPLTYKKIALTEDITFKTANLWFIEVPKNQKKIMLEGKYSGIINQSNWVKNQINDKFIELALYGLWYPVIPGMKNHTFKLTLNAPKDWLWVANGEEKSVTNQEQSKQWIWENTQLDHDITLLGLPEIDAHKKPESVFWGPEEYVAKNKIYEDLLLERKQVLEDWLGNPIKDAGFTYAFTPRTTGGQYSRNGLIVTVQELPKEEDMISRVLNGMLHEVCHFWWHKTPMKTYDNWLDEALCEYCSAIIVSENYGGEEWLKARDERVLQALEKGGELPAINEIIRSHKDAFVVYYYRGYLLFRKLEQLIGKESLKELIKSLLEINKERNELHTEDFLNLIEDSKILSTIKEILSYSGKGMPK